MTAICSPATWPETPMDFEGKVVLVTGAAQGIGEAVARLFAAAGARLAVADRQAGPLEAVATAVRAFALPFDLAAGDADAAVTQIERAVGPIDVLANVAAVLRPGAALDAPDADWDATFAINTFGTLRLTRAVARGMVARGRGVIVTVGSNAAATPRLGMAAYAASKAATAQLMRCLALELAPHGVRCNLVSPGSTDTPMQRQLWTADNGPANVIRGSADAWRLGIPLQRIAQPQDIAEAVCFLASDRARHITMHDLRVDGGATFDA